MQIGEIKTKDLIFYGGTLVAIVFFFTNIKQDLALQTQKTDYLIAQVDKLATSVEGQNGKIGAHDIDITNIKKDIDFLGKAQGLRVSTSQTPDSAKKESTPLASAPSSRSTTNVKVEKEDTPATPASPPRNFDDDENEVASVKVPPIVSDLADALKGN